MADYNPNQFTPEVGALQREARGERRVSIDSPKKERDNDDCPEGAVLIIKGEHFFCDAMRHMHPSCHTHEGWPHASQAAEAVWGETHKRKVCR